MIFREKPITIKCLGEWCEDMHARCHTTCMHVVVSKPYHNVIDMLEATILFCVRGEFRNGEKERGGNKHSKMLKSWNSLEVVQAVTRTRSLFTLAKALVFWDEPQEMTARLNL